MRILFILENYYPNIGGVETLFKSLAETLASQGFKITVLTNRFDKSLNKEETINGVHIKRLNLYNRYVFTFFAGFKAISLARQSDIIHTTSYNAAIPAFIASLFSRKKSIITFHEVWGPLWFRLPFMNKFSLFLHYCFELFILKIPFYKFVAISQSTRNNLIHTGISESKIEMIYNGIEYDDFIVSDFNHNNKIFQFCYFGRLGISKGLDIILDAVETLSKENVKFNFLLIVPLVPNDFLMKIKKLIKQKNIESFIQFKHELSFDDLKENILKSDTVVIPSYSEGFCFTAIESMALGKPIISSGNGALSEVIGGRYLEMKHQTGKALAECMQQAMTGIWNIKPEKKYPLDASVRAYVKLYSGLHLN